MGFNTTVMDLPFINRFSLAKLLDEIEILQKSEDKFMAAYAKSLLEEVNRFPALKDGIDSPAGIEEHMEPIRKVLRFVFPDALTHNEIKAVVMPFSFETFHASARFQEIIKAAGPGFKIQLKEMDESNKFIVACLTILNQYYGYPVEVNTPFLVDIPNKALDITKTYRIAFNADFMEIEPTKKSIPITKADYYELMNNFNDVSVWKEKFPKNSWVFKGMGIANLMDVTTDQSLAGITSNLLTKTEQSWENLRHNIRKLLNINDLEGSFVGFEDNCFVEPPHAIECSFMLNHDGTVHNEDLLCEFSRNQLLMMREPLAIPNVDEFHKMAHSRMSTNLKAKKIKSYLLIPMLYQDNLLGFLEFASKKKHQLNASSVTKLKPILPMLSMAVNRFKEEEKNQIEAIIQQKYTTIHPSVKWKFEEIAKKYLVKELDKQPSHLDDIVFQEVYPLYGQLDIRQSSTKRNEAVKSDLLYQLGEVLNVLNDALKESPLPIYEELIFRVQQYEQEIKNGVLAGSEQKVLNLMEEDVFPLFDHLKRQNSTISESIERFYGLLDKELRMIYRDRKAFDNSITTTNQLLANLLDNKQEEAQSMFPHYFERYKTDGIEYNIYVGQSLLKTATFDPVYLRNLRLWQLLVTCEMERAFKAMHKELSSPLEIASLILVYSSALSVHFRMDEKRFDVNGAYNARYEIVKKRVDKACVKGTTERITQPGHIAVIYSGEQDALEYQRYFKYMISKNYLLNEPIEELEVEDLQGITGLKALRVAINFDTKRKQSEWNIESVLKEIEIQPNN
jgi:hypothetical protein